MQLKILLGILVLHSTLLSAVHGADFIESVHAQGADIAKEMVVEGGQVVWSPFSVVNVLPLINGDESLKNGFKNAIESLKDNSGGITINRLTSGFVKDKIKMESLANEYGVELNEFPGAEKEVREAVEDKYKEELGVEPPAGLLPEALGNTSQLFLTSLLVTAEWETPFKYAPKGRFFINETHAVKAKYMSSIGFYNHGKLAGVDANILAIPLKNSSTTFLLVVVPENSSLLTNVSQQFAAVEVGNIMDKLVKKRTQLTLPKITVDSQLLLQPLPTVKILQSGSIRFSYFGVDNRASKLRRTPTRILRTRANKQDVKFNVNRSFIYLIFDTKVGVLNYGEVLIPIDTTYPHVSLKSEDQGGRLTQNARSLSELIHEKGNAYFIAQNVNEGTFAFAPLSFANLLGSFATVTNKTTQEVLFSTLNFKAGLVELSQAISYDNVTSTNSTEVFGGNEELAKEVTELGTTVTFDKTNGTNGCSKYSYEVNLKSTRRYMKTFYRNERDSNNVTFYEYIAHVKYLSLPFMDARAVLIYLNQGQSLLLFVPNERSGLHMVEDGLKDFSVSKLLCQMRDRHARIRLPSFKVQTSRDFLASALQVNGLTELTSENLGPVKSLQQETVISVIGGEDPLKLSRYSYNKYTMNRRRPSTRVNVDRPFVFYLLDKAGTLAIGRVTEIFEEPEEDEDAPSLAVKTTPQPVKP